ARPHTDFRSQHHGVEGLVRDNPEPAVEINVDDARDRGIETGDLVEVSTPRGAVPFRARVTTDIVQGSIECNMGGGTAVGPEAWREWNVNELTDLGNYDDVSGFPVYKALLADVRKIENATETARRHARRQAGPCDPTPLTIQDPVPEPRRRVYLDNNATTELDDAVRGAMEPFLATRHGNPSAIHGVGREAREGIETARRQVAKLINARPRTIVFTGGGSEADNHAVKGVAFARRDRGNHIITTTVEHPAILAATAFLERLGYRVTYLDVDEYGVVSPASLRSTLTDETILVSVMMANNEVGTIQPIRELCAITHEGDAYFHCDAVQAAGKVRVDVEELGVDLLTLSAHKFHGPKGVGALYVRPGIELESLVHGGKQEHGRRAGTENVAAIVGMGKAAELAAVKVSNGSDLGVLRDKLEAGIRELVPGARLNGHPKDRLPNTLNMTLPDLRGESLVVSLDQRGIALSSGSACKAGSPDPTHVLLAMGRSDEDAHCSVRFSLSHATTGEDIDDALAALAQVLEEMETTVRFLPCK
ncbi:MAG: aminotransferase class V-fold PLP-dependent enzyme, partial [Acidobacteriota bacterium]|nr:aminotransferase class V-fold PLP-dependent enzyme [Acidobacteriota bacterium]